MVDSNGQPLARVNYGIENGESYRFGGKEVEIVEPEVIKDWDLSLIHISRGARCITFTARRAPAQQHS